MYLRSRVLRADHSWEQAEGSCSSQGNRKPGVVAHTYDPSILEAETGGLPTWV